MVRGESDQGIAVCVGWPFAKLILDPCMCHVDISNTERPSKDLSLRFWNIFWNKNFIEKAFFGGRN